VLEQPLMTVAELQTRLRIGRSTAYRLCKQPTFPAVRVGGQIRIPVDSLERWLAHTGAAAGHGSDKDGTSDG
jgi:excisionase family DNA binding protein